MGTLLYSNTQLLNLSPKSSLHTHRHPYQTLVSMGEKSRPEAKTHTWSGRVENQGQGMFLGTEYKWASKKFFLKIWKSKVVLILTLAGPFFFYLLLPLYGKRWSLTWPHFYMIFPAKLQFLDSSAYQPVFTTLISKAHFISISATLRAHIPVALKERLKGRALQT